MPLDLHLVDVSRRFGSRPVLRNVCAAVRSGEALAVTGPNGSGKSTLLAVIAGLLRPDSGAVQLLDDGREITREERRTRVGMVSPDLTFYPELSAEENLAFFARTRGLAAPRGGVEALLDRVGLGGRGRDLVGTFSSGMRVRLKYAVALHGEPELLLLDEPTAMLDPSGVRLVEEVIAVQRGRGTLVLATNDADEARHGDLLVDLGAAQEAV